MRLAEQHRISRVSLMLGTIGWLGAETASAADPSVFSHAQDLFDAGRYCEAMTEFKNLRPEIDRSFDDNPSFADKLIDSLSRCGAIAEALDTLEKLVPRIDTVAEETREHWRAWFKEKKRLLENLEVSIQLSSVSTGERLQLNGADITDQVLGGSRIFVERGTYCLTATAPARTTWTQCGRAAALNRIAVPPLTPVAPPQPKKLAVEPQVSSAQALNLKLLLPAAIGAATTVTGLVWYLDRNKHANDAYEAYQVALADGSADAIRQRHGEVQAARDQRTVAQAFTLTSAGLTAGVLIAMGSLWLFGHNDDAGPSAAAGVPSARKYPAPRFQVGVAHPRDARVDATFEF